MLGTTQREKECQKNLLAPENFFMSLILAFYSSPLQVNFLSNQQHNATHIFPNEGHIEFNVSYSQENVQRTAIMGNMFPVSVGLRVYTIWVAQLVQKHTHHTLFKCTNLCLWVLSVCSIKQLCTLMLGCDWWHLGTIPPPHVEQVFWLLKLCSCLLFMDK